MKRVRTATTATITENNEVTAIVPVTVTEYNPTDTIMEENTKRHHNNSFKQKLAKRNAKRHGVGNSRYNEPIPNGLISRVASIAVPEDLTVYKEYTSELIKGSFKDIMFYNECGGKMDHSIYKMVHAFLEGNAGTAEYECVIMDITRLSNIIRRAILGRPMRGERIKSKVIHESYYRARRIGCGVDYFKFVAWVVAHAYCTGLFLDKKGIYDMIPKNDPTVIPVWNTLINFQDDVPKEVKSLFMFGDDGYCPYVEANKELFSFKKRDDSEIDSNDVEEPFDVNEDNKELAEECAELDEQYRTAVANDKDVEEETVSVSSDSEPKVVESVPTDAEAKEETATSDKTKADEVKETVSDSVSMKQEADEEELKAIIDTKAHEFTFGELMKPAVTYDNVGTTVDEIINELRAMPSA